MNKIIPAFFAIFAAASLQAFGAPSPDEYFPFKKQPLSVWDKAMSPQSGTASFIINNRPIGYITEPFTEDVSRFDKIDILTINDARGVSDNYRLSERYLQRALEVAREHQVENPDDIVKCLANLGTLYYQLGHYTDAEPMFSEALADGKQLWGANHLEIANLQDYLALVYRGQRKYTQALEPYKRSLEIRQQGLGVKHPEVAASYMNLAMCYADAGQPEQEKALAKAYEIMGDRAYIDRSISSAPSPISTFMPLKTTTDGELPQMVAFASGIIEKYPPPAPPDRPAAPRPPEGIASIVGRFSVATDEVALNRTRTASYKQETLGGEEAVTDTKEEAAVSQFENVPIRLCHAAAASTIYAQVKSYAKQHGLNADAFGTDWPLIKRQALELKQMMDNVAARDEVSTERTDAEGEYQFDSIPKGDFIMYASLATQSQVLFWISNTIDIKQKAVFSYNFTQDSATATMWSKGSKTAMVYRH